MEEQEHIIIFGDAEDGVPNGRRKDLMCDAENAKWRT
jgi:hypothetical protein